MSGDQEPDQPPDASSRIRLRRVITAAWVGAIAAVLSSVIVIVNTFIQADVELERQIREERRAAYLEYLTKVDALSTAMYSFNFCDDNDNGTLPYAERRAAVQLAGDQMFEAETSVQFVASTEVASSLVRHRPTDTFGKFEQLEREVASTPNSLPCQEAQPGVRELVNESFGPEHRPVVNAMRSELGYS